MDPQRKGRDHQLLARISDCQLDQDLGGGSGVELALVLALVTGSHLGYLQVVVRGAYSVHQ